MKLIKKYGLTALVVAISLSGFIALAYKMLEKSWLSGTPLLTYSVLFGSAAAGLVLTGLYYLINGGIKK